MSGPEYPKVDKRNHVPPSLDTSGWLWDSPKWRKALAELNLGDALVTLRTSMGLSQEDFGSVVGWSQKTVSNVERGHRDTLYDIRELLRVVDRLGLPRMALLPLLEGEANDMADINRRTFTLGLLSGAATLSLASSAAVPPKVDAAHTRYLSAYVQEVRNRDQMVGGGAVLEQALAQLERARAMLDEGDYSAAVGRELLVITADMGVACGWVAYDAGNQALARRLYRESALLAESTDDNELLVHVYANMAMQSTNQARLGGQWGLAREALRLADRAAEAVRHHPSSRLHALVALRQARAHAQLGDKAAFRAAITRARRDLDRSPHPADPAWARFVTPTEVTGHEAMGHHFLGSPARAAELYREMIDDSSLLPRNRAYYRSVLAGTLLEEGDTAQAITEGLTVLPSLEGRQLTSRRILDELRSVRRVAEERAAEEFVQRFERAERVLAA